jgi:hypothetical protein
MRPNSDFQVNLCSQKDLEGLIKFLKRMREEKIISFPLDKTFFIGKYGSSRGSSAPFNLFILKNRQKEIIGCSGYVPFRGMFCKKNIEGIVGSDIVIDPGYGRKFPSLFATLFFSYSKFVLKEGYFFLNFPQSDVIASNFRRFWWEDFTHFFELSNPLSLRISPNIGTISIETRRIEHFDKEINSFFKRISSQHHFLLCSDFEFLNRRYFDNPYHKYVVILATKESKILGYLVAEEIGYDIEIVDVVVDLDYPLLILLLMYKSFTYFGQNKIGKVFSYLSHKHYIEVLKKIGFFCHTKKICLFFKICLLFSKIKEHDLARSDKNLYHLNGFTRYSY